MQFRQFQLRRESCVEKRICIKEQRIKKHSSEHQLKLRGVQPDSCHVTGRGRLFNEVM